ncbi:MAG TPA: zf-HC2 domain-containing protein [Gaiellaceae bacterium]|nr:zf-HC2 domain-containing protein [Gaiellaceae bacterium]
MTHDPGCEKCEELLQGYLDRQLDAAEVVQAEAHLDGCDYCRRRYRFEETLRRYVKVSATERMPPGLLDKLAELAQQPPRAL